MKIFHARGSISAGAFLMTLFSALRAAGGEVYVETTSIIQGGVSISINGFPVVGLANPNNADITLSSNSLVGGFLKSGDNEIAFHVSPVDEVALDKTRLKFRIAKDGEEFFSYDNPRPPIMVNAAALGDGYAVVFGSPPDALDWIHFAAYEPDAGARAWRWAMDFGDVPPDFKPKGLTFVGDSKGLALMDVSLVIVNGRNGQAVSRIAHGLEVTKEEAGSAHVDLGAIEFPNWPEFAVKRIVLTVPIDERHLNDNTIAEPLGLSDLTFHARADPADTVKILRLQALADRVWEKADTLPDPLADADKAAVHAVVGKLHSALNAKNIDDLAGLMSVKIAHAAQATGMTAMDLEAKMRRFFADLVFAEPGWGMTPYPDVKHVRFEIHANRRVVEPIGMGGQPVLSSLPLNGVGGVDDRFLMPLRLIRENGRWQVLD